MLDIQSRQSGGLWSVIVAATLWGTIGVATQAIYTFDNTTTSLFINLARMAIATPVLLAACWRVIGTRMFAIRPRDALLMALSGSLLAISQAAYFAAIPHIGVTIATLLAICIAPVIVTCGALTLKLETLTRRKIMALVCALVGSVLLVGFNASDAVQKDVLTGVIFSVIAATAYSGMILCGRSLAANYHPLQVTTVMFGAGTLLLLILNLTGEVVTVQTPAGWLLVVYLGLVPTAVAYLLFQMGLRSVAATAASILAMLEPLVAALLAWGLFGETLGATGVAGAALMLMSVSLLSVTEGE